MTSTMLAIASTTVAAIALTACGGGSGSTGAEAALQLRPQATSTAAPSSTPGSPSVTSSTASTSTTTKPAARATAQGVSRDRVRSALTPRPTTTKTAPKTQPTPKRTRAPRSGSTAGLDLSRAAMWDRIAQCESTGNWHINTGNGYYGGLQFDIRTWLGAGGGKFAGRADLATREQQITIANKVYASRGLSPWACASAA